MAYRPLVSVLIASYNHEQFLEETLMSVWAQSYPNIELVVIDDCSTDGSWSLLQRLNVLSPVPMTISRNESNIGPGGTVNIALSKAKGELIVIGASDDLFAENSFVNAINIFGENPDLLAVYGNGQAFDNNKKGGLIHREKAVELLAMEPEKIRHYLYTNSSPLFLQAGVFKKSVIEQVGGFDTSIMADDWLLTTRIFQFFSSTNQYIYIPDIVVYYRQHQENLHKNYERQERLKIEFIEKVTPKKYKSEGFSNIYFWAAQNRLANKEFFLAMKYFFKSQLSMFRWDRRKFISKFLKNWLGDR